MYTYVYVYVHQTNIVFFWTFPGSRGQIKSGHKFHLFRFQLLTENPQTLIEVIPSNTDIYIN